MDEFGLDEERFFALSSPEDGGDAAGASPGGRAERAMPGCSGPERDAPWDAADILVPHRPPPLQSCLRHCAFHMSLNVSASGRGEALHLLIGAGILLAA